VFRAIHSIKGGAGAFGFTRLVGFAHAFESLLDQVRDGRIELSPSVTALCMRSNDIVADFVTAAREGNDLPEAFGAEEKLRFDALCNGGSLEDLDGAPMDEFDIDFTPVRVVLKSDADEAEANDADSFDMPPLDVGGGQWEIRFAPHQALYARANDPLLLLRELGTLGELEVRPILAEMPLLADFEPFGVYCTWEISLFSSEVTEAAIREVFEFVEGDCDIRVVQIGAADLGLSAPVPMAAMADSIADEGPDLTALADALKPVKAAPAVVPIAAATPAASAPQAAAHEEGDRKAQGVQSIRVDLDKVDRVVNMVGELVITQSMLTQQMDEHLRTKYQELVRGLEVLAQTTRGLQDSVMAIRAQPVKSVFSRMPRLVRELALKTGKAIRLETIGENTEIDKTVIEQLSDPLTHMIRNSADHGIEPAEKRMALGKPETGTIRLSAEQAGGNILIIVEDDGAGINRERVLRVAKERGVVAPDQQLTDEQIDQLIFAPGFSTAETVSDLSGRGVGMDVVLSNIKKIGGSVHVRSVTGKGTRMTLRLPLTLAVLDVMLVRVAGHPYVIPLSSIVETIQCARADFGRVPSGGKVLQLRGDYVQVIDLAERFGMQDRSTDDSRFVVLCEAEGSMRLALIVEDIIGQQQVVIKSLEENFQRIEGIAGGTILGDGNVALIVDVPSLRTAPPHRSAA
jgi:two-component system, chemotaxis family, sensor kinase CheA